MVGKYAAKPIVLDDTIYFIPCHTKREATYIASLLNSSSAQTFFKAFIFWDAKRPITIEILRRLDLLAVAQELGSTDELTRYLTSKSTTGNGKTVAAYVQSDLFNPLSQPLTIKDR